MDTSKMAPSNSVGIPNWTIQDTIDKCASDHACIPSDVMVLEIRQFGKTYEGDGTFAEIEMSYPNPDGTNGKARAIYGIINADSSLNFKPVCFCD